MAPPALPEQTSHIYVIRYRNARDTWGKRGKAPFSRFYESLQRFEDRPDIPKAIAEELAALDRVEAGGDAPIRWRARNDAATYQEDLKDRVGVERIERLNKWREWIPKRAKALLAAWSPAVIPEGQPRKNANVIGISALVLDYDGGDYSQEAAFRPWVAWEHIRHTTWSHTEEAPKWRIVLPLQRVVPAALWPRAWEWARRHSGGLIDEKCKDLSRVYFLPASPASTAHRSARVVSEGRSLLALHDERFLPELPDPPKPRQFKRVQVHSQSVDKVLRERLKNDPGTRQRLGEALEGRVMDGKVRHLPCPNCGERSVWFFINGVAGGMNQARCNHRNGCGWHGWLDQLVSAIIGGEA